MQSYVCYPMIKYVVTLQLKGETMIKLKTYKGDAKKLEGWTTGLSNAAPLELSKWDEKDDTAFYSTIEWAALRYAAIAFLEDNKERFRLNNIQPFDYYNSFSSGTLYLNDFEGYYCYEALKNGVTFSYLTYTTEGRIIIVGYELDKDGEPTEKERAWLLD